MGTHYILMGCGHKEKVYLSEKSSLTISERKEYLENNGLCKECYKAAKRKEEKEQGLIFNVSIFSHVDRNDGGILLYVWFSGDTITYKESIKSLGGYWWGFLETSDVNYLKRPDMGWHKVIKLENLDEEYAKAVSIGTRSIVTGRDSEERWKYHMALRNQKDWKEMNEKISGIKSPEVPEILRGHRWNRTVYGKSGRYSVYLDNDKVPVTDDEASMLKEYIEDKEKYLERVAEIKSSYSYAIY